MTQNLPLRSNTSLKDTVKNKKKAQADSKASGPFIFAKLPHQAPSNHQVSSPAHWSNSEKERYAVFVSYFRELMKEEREWKGNWDAFKGMSRFVKTRNPQQCRSHHLKLVRQFKGISRFIVMVMERVPRLRERMEQAENELSEIQLQFNLYLSESNVGNLCSVKENKLFQEDDNQSGTVNHLLLEKADKQEFIKTADSYLQQQHPVNSNHFNSSIFSSRSEFKPFHTFKSKPQRSSLPSFDNDSNNYDQPNFQHHFPRSANHLSHPISTLSFPNLEQPKLSSSNDNFSVVPENQGPSNIILENMGPSSSEAKSIEKMKEFFQCHYLFQLWTTKLQKIMRES